MVREMVAGSEKQEWQGVVIAVQPRIRLSRSFDERYHGYLGYTLLLRGKVAGVAREFSVGIGKAAQAKHRFRAGDEARGAVVPVADPETEAADYYKASELRLLKRAEAGAVTPPPWQGVPPTLAEYRARGHRRLDARTYAAKCQVCIWGCRMAVDIILDKWNPSVRKHRFETFCYGPKSCPLHRAGPTRKVPGRHDMQWEEEDWVDEEAVAHRSMDE